MAQHKGLSVAVVGLSVLMLRLALLPLFPIPIPVAANAFSFWTNTYHEAGSLGRLGGSLVLGAMLRLIKTARLRYAILLAFGASILALTCAYEGLLL